MKNHTFMIIGMVSMFAFGCDKVASTPSEHSQGGLGAEAPASSNTNALGHGASSSHPQTFGQGKFSPKGGYAPSGDYTSSDDEKGESPKGKPGGY